MTMVEEEKKLIKRFLKNFRNKGPAILAFYLVEAGANTSTVLREVS
jgi:hypothetical protein